VNFKPVKELQILSNDWNRNILDTISKLKLNIFKYGNFLKNAYGRNLVDTVIGLCCDLEFCA